MRRSQAYLTHRGFTPEVDQFEGNAMGDIAEKVYTEKENDVNSFVNKDIGNNDSNSVNNNVEPTDLDRSKLLRSAKIKWAIEGDENVKFFHGILNKKRSQSQIRGVMANGVWIDDPVKDSPLLLSSFLVMIEDDVFGAVEYFFINGDIPNGCNSNFIALIPKIIDANMVKDFRPISLIGSLYKIIAKLLANRLVGVLSNLINEVQSAFVADRQIRMAYLFLRKVLSMIEKRGNMRSF
ncbi:hypothetical protein Tco_0577539 [Tanacetum coccineum]|uniref:Reverse transcriptase domain-containing protein n=1 Tax=Tanacetum coccineum TaxID=301880 RepID=A0ABQ5J3Y7_9ASTR